MAIGGERGTRRSPRNLRPTKDSCTASSAKATTRKIAKSSADRSFITYGTLPSRCKKVQHVKQSSQERLLDESSSSLNLNEANVNNHVDPLESLAAAIYAPALCTSTSRALVVCEKNKGVAAASPTAQICPLEDSGHEHLSRESHSATPSSSHAPIASVIEAADMGGTTPSRAAATSVLTQMVNNFQYDSSDEAEVGSAPPNLVRVHDYNVQEASAGILGDIIKKYGDIAANCNVTTSANRSRLLETVCDIVQELKETKFKDMTQASIENQIANVSDLKSNQMDVDWLSKRLEDLHNAKLLIVDMRTLKKRKNKLIQERGEAMAKIIYADAEIEDINRNALEAQPKLLPYTKSSSMADGLL